jgi:hypothetical protein
LQLLGLAKEKAMFELLVFAFAAAAQEQPPPLLGRDPGPGVTQAENRTLSQPHPFATARTFPDMAIKGLRIDGDTLHVLVANDGEARARGPIRIAARAEADGAKAEAAPARTGSLASGQSRWVPLRNFSVKSASAARSGSVFALEDAALVWVSVALAPAMSPAVDRTGQACLPSRGCMLERNEANNSVRAIGKAIPRGRP